MEAKTEPQRTLLVVDDDPWTRTVTTALLVGEGYAVMAARNGEEALDIVAHEDLQAVLLDLALPTISGLDVLRALKAGRARSGLPVFVLSAYAGLMEARDAERADGVFQKPLDYDALLDALRRVSAPARGAKLAASR